MSEPFRIPRWPNTDTAATIASRNHGRDIKQTAEALRDGLQRGNIRAREMSAGGCRWWEFGAAS